MTAKMQTTAAVSAPADDGSQLVTHVTEAASDHITRKPDITTAETQEASVSPQAALGPAQEDEASPTEPSEGEQGAARDSDSALLRSSSASARKTPQMSAGSSRKSSLVPKGQSRSRSKSVKASSTRRDVDDDLSGGSEAVDERIGPAEVHESAAAATQENDPTPLLMSRTQRSSSSSTKALSGLGLAHLGDGDESNLAPRRTRRGAAATSPSAAGKAAGEEEDIQKERLNDDAKSEQGLGPDEEGDGDADGDIEGVTRCVCGSEDENVGLMIQCEICKCWQHCVCMGMQTEEECPDVYYCEQCKPELHIPLLRALGVLPPAGKGNKKLGKNARKESLKELMQARDAVALLAQQNVQRRKEGQDVVVAHLPSQPSKRPGEARRNTSESAHDQEVRSTRDTSDVPPSPRGGPSGADRRSPKRRSTMNSRDSGYGWEPIPPGLLNEDEVWEDTRPKKEDEEGSASGRKRKRTGGRRDDEGSSSPPGTPPMGPAELAKRRRMSSSAAASSSNVHSNSASSHRGEGRRRSPSEAQDAPLTSASQNGNISTLGSGKKSGSGNAIIAKGAEKKGREDGSLPVLPPPVKSKQPNQYTYRKERLANGAVAGVATGVSGGISTGRTVSPTPSPSKSGRRGAAALREGSAMVSRTSTPAPGEARTGGNSRTSHLSGGGWGLPEHLSHLVNLLPSSQPEPLTLHLPSTRGVPNPRSTAAKDSHSDALSSSRPSPHPFTIVDISEPPTKVRWPPKRMTMGEMRKRVRNISEYVTNKQLEAVERGKRMKDLGIGIEHSSPDVELSGESTGGKGAIANPDADEMEGVEATNGTAGGSTMAAMDQTDAPLAGKERIPLSMKLMDELTRELIAFQQKFGVPPGSVAVLGAQFGSYNSTNGLGIGNPATNGSADRNGAVNPSQQSFLLARKNQASDVKDIGPLVPTPSNQGASERDLATVTTVLPVAMEESAGEGVTA